MPIGWSKNKPTGLFIVILTLLPLLLFAVEPVAAHADYWTQKTPMPTERESLGVACVDDKIYAIGGHGGSTKGTVFCGINEMYNPATNSWTTLASMPTSRSRFGATVYHNQIYCFGGLIFDEVKDTGTNTKQATDVTEVYNPATDTWRKGAPMPKTEGATVANMVDGQIYVITGQLMYVYSPQTDSWRQAAYVPLPLQVQASCVVGKEIYAIDGSNSQVYNTQTDTWALATPIPQTIVGGVSAACTITDTAGNSRIFVVGGLDGIYTPTLIYDPKFQIWGTGTQMPHLTNNLGITVLDGHMYAIGGLLGSDETDLAQVYTPSPYSALPSPTTFLSVTGNWTTVAAMPTARLFLSVATVNGKIYAIGGESDDSDVFFATNEMYDPSTDTWTTMAPMPTARSSFGIAISGDKIYCIGGVVAVAKNSLTAGETVTGANEVYDTKTNTWTKLAPLHTTRGSVAAGVVDGKIYIISGGASVNQYYFNGENANEVYDPKTDTWSTATSIPQPYRNSAYCVVDNQVYVIGGSWSGYSAINQIYDAKTDSWLFGTPVPQYNGLFVASAVKATSGESVIFVVGEVPAQVYDVNSRSWSNITQLPTARLGLGVAAVDNRLFAIGGCVSGTASNLNEVFTANYTQQTQETDFNLQSLTMAVYLVAVAVVAVGVSVALITIFKIKQNHTKNSKP